MSDPIILESLRRQLEIAVPLWFGELGLPGSWNTLANSGEFGTIAETIAEKCDLVLNGPAKGVARGEVAEAFSALARGIAILSAVPGGYTIFGMKWEGGFGRRLPNDGRDQAIG
jgi:hypothetical protein